MKHNFSTKLIHQGDEKGKLSRAVGIPIYQTSTYEMGEEEIYHEILYGRLNNSPAHRALHDKLASIEGAEGALTFSSGMAAITTALMSTLKPGDHLMIQNCVYGGTYGFLIDEAEKYGWQVSWVDTDDIAAMEAAVRDNTKLLYVESISNPLLQVPDFEGIISFAKKHGLKTMTDNTFASPYNFQAVDFGFDIAVHSATKYINGHTDVIAGAVMGSKKDIRGMQEKLAHYGGCLDPNSVYLLNRGLKTLAVRMDRHNENALKLAQFLQSHPKVNRVTYPGLETDPSFERTKKYLVGGSGMLSFEVDGDVSSVLRKLKIPVNAPSLGGVESLVVVPAKSSHAGQSEEELKKIGLSKSLIRVSVGIEDVEDLIADFDQALS